MDKINRNFNKINRNFNKIEISIKLIKVVYPAFIFKTESVSSNACTTISARILCKGVPIL